jgi:hypothetical protein
MSTTKPWSRRRRWSTGIVLVLVVLAALGYQRLSAGPEGETIGSCTIVNHPSVDDRTSCPDAELADRDLGERDLRLADLHGIDLSGADLRGAILYGADLTGADLRGTDLRGADLTSAKLTDARLGDTRFAGATVSGMDVTGTPLAATARSVWSEGDAPVLLKWTSGRQPGIVQNTCDDREGLFYPGSTAVTCQLSTGTDVGQSLQYQIQMEVKQAPVISAPDTVTLTAGRSASVQVHADSPYPQVEAHIIGRLPKGLRWDAATQRIVGTPKASAVGERTVVLRAENGRTVRQSIRIVVLAP